jgi:hypothetical protein
VIRGGEGQFITPDTLGRLWRQMPRKVG